VPFVVTWQVPKALERSIPKVAVFLLLALVFGAGYFWGVFSTSFDTNLCYNEVIDIVQTEAGTTLSAGTPDSRAKFQAFLRSLPLAGYETNCPEVLKAAKKEATMQEGRAPNQRLERP
jgi:hypothetical protein